jgi:hypothetical protein
LVPAGTGFHAFQESEVRIRPQALEALAAEKERALVRSFPLLDGVDDGNGANGGSQSQAPKGPAPSLESLLGGDKE